jgi:hypothetical protein
MCERPANKLVRFGNHPVSFIRFQKWTTENETLVSFICNNTSTTQPKIVQPKKLLWLNAIQFCISYTLYRYTNSLQYSAVFSRKKKTLSKVYILEWLLEITMIYTLFHNVHLNVSVVIYRKALGIDFFRIWMNACQIRCMFSETWEGPWLFSSHGHRVGSNWR